MKLLLPSSSYLLSRFRILQLQWLFLQQNVKMNYAIFSCQANLSLNKMPGRYRFASVMGTHEKPQSLLLWILRGKNIIYKWAGEFEATSSSETNNSSRLQWLFQGPDMREQQESVSLNFWVIACWRTVVLIAEPRVGTVRYRQAPGIELRGFLKRGEKG